MKKHLASASSLGLILFSMLFSACDDDKSEPEVLNTKIVVISDPHYFSPSLLKSDGKAFQTYLMGDRKLIAESSAILDETLKKIMAEKPALVLIAGDLTKDGEKQSHTELASKLEQLIGAGIKVYVTPGNHDVNNPDAHSYNGDVATKVEHVTPADFETIYKNCGYANAIARGPKLSYISEPIKNLWIMSLDVCHYTNNTNHPETQGSMSAELLSWAKTKLQEAKSKDITVLGMMHHGLLEHFQGQKSMFSEYVINDWENVADQLAEAGLKFMFTGHYHAQDIVMRNHGANTIYDIETGSLVTAPCPYRIVKITNAETLEIDSRKIESINYPAIPAGSTFQSYAKSNLETGLPIITNYLLSSAPYNLPAEQVKMLSPVITESFIAHYAGDETDPKPENAAVLNALMKSADPLSLQMGGIISSIWNDHTPGDNSVRINIKTGELIQ